jgi:hypothetical protein
MVCGLSSAFLVAYAEKQVHHAHVGADGGGLIVLLLFLRGSRCGRPGESAHRKREQKHSISAHVHSGPFENHGNFSRLDAATPT